LAIGFIEAPAEPCRGERAEFNHPVLTFQVRFSTDRPVSSGCPQVGKQTCGPTPPAATLEPEVMAMRAKDVLGKSGEQAAADYLESCGLRILDRNWRSADGEIDIVAVERHVLVVCEVKSRTSTRYGSPLEAVSRAKRIRLRRLAVQWLNAHGVRFDQVRIDVVGLVYEGTGGFTIEHIRAVG
jgi:putative endonuclease